MKPNQNPENKHFPPIKQKKLKSGYVVQDKKVDFYNDIFPSFLLHNFPFCTQCCSRFKQNLSGIIRDLPSLVALPLAIMFSVQKPTLCSWRKVPFLPCGCSLALAHHSGWGAGGKLVLSSHLLSGLGALGRACSIQATGF